jgi:catechol 2,3-dioxygenase
MQLSLTSAPAATPLDPGSSVGTADLIVADLDRAVRFYTETLGFTRLEQRDDAAFLAAGTGAPWLRLTAMPGARRKPRSTTGLYHIAILTPDRPALARSLRRLVDVGYPLQGASDHLVSEALYLADPDGNGLEIYRDRPRADWPHMGDMVRMDTLPLDLQALYDEAVAADLPWTGMASATHLGHVHLHVADLAAAVAFYSEVIGFDVMIQMGQSAAFLSAGGYHHHLGLNTWAGVGAPPPPADAVGLRGYTIALPDAAERDRVLARLRAAQIAIADHDGMPAVRDPSGNAVWLDVVGA